jgi:2-methylcitrate dehydratase PrpD
VVPGILALAEKHRASGRDLITACVIAHEISARLSAASSQMIASLTDTGSTPHVFGINDESIIGAAAGMSKLLGLSEMETAHAIGLAAYYCPPQSSHDWETGTPKSMVKYTPVGCVARGSVTAALLAQAGFTANPAVLDGPAGFPDFYGWPAWKPAAAVRELGATWRIENVDFKPHACCRFIHSQIDCLIALMNKHAFKPQQILSIHSLGVPFVANPDQREVNTQPDAQFSIPYMLAIAAHGLPIDAHAQDAARLRDPDIRSMMNRITWEIHPDAERSKRADARSYIARVEISTTDGRTLVEESLYARGTGANSGARLTDDELDRKFVDNATTRLKGAAARAAADLLWKLENASDITRVVDALTLR